MTPGDRLDRLRELMGDGERTPAQDAVDAYEAALDRGDATPDELEALQRQMEEAIDEQLKGGGPCPEPVYPLKQGWRDELQRQTSQT